jgi:hypothetical protein
MSGSIRYGGCESESKAELRTGRTVMEPGDQLGMFPIAYGKKTDFLRRLFATWNPRWTRRNSS